MLDIQRGQTVICINNSTFDGDIEYDLTVSRAYTVLEIHKHSVRVSNDAGIVEWFAFDYFFSAE